MQWWLRGRTCWEWMTEEGLTWWTWWVLQGPNISLPWRTMHTGWSWRRGHMCTTEPKWQLRGPCPTPSPPKVQLKVLIIPTKIHCLLQNPILNKIPKIGNSSPFLTCAQSKSIQVCKSLSILLPFRIPRECQHHHEDEWSQPTQHSSIPVACQIQKYNELNYQTQMISNTVTTNFKNISTMTHQWHESWPPQLQPK